MKIGYEWCLPRNEPAVYCVRRVNAHRALCGRKTDWGPILQPVFMAVDAAVHRECFLLLQRRRPGAEEATYGVCPACGGEVPLADGVVAKHPAWVMSRNGPSVGSKRCPGEGENPE